MWQGYMELRRLERRQQIKEWAIDLGKVAVLFLFMFVMFGLLGSCESPDRPHVGVDKDIIEVTDVEELITDEAEDTLIPVEDKDELMTDEPGSDDLLDEDGPVMDDVAETPDDSTIVLPDNVVLPDDVGGPDNDNAPLLCGNGTVDTFDGENCDDGVNDGSCGRCKPGCRTGLAKWCGDGTVQTECGENCDDGVNDGSYGHCKPGCITGLGLRCGDGIVQADEGENCDDGVNDGTYGHCGPGCDTWENTLLWSESGESFVDSRTGLRWWVNNLSKTPYGPDDTYSYYAGGWGNYSTAVTTCNKEQDGLSGWRIPTINELRTLITCADTMPNGICKVHDDNTDEKDNWVMEDCRCERKYEVSYNELGFPTYSIGIGSNRDYQYLLPYAYHDNWGNFFGSIWSSTVTTNLIDNSSGTHLWAIAFDRGDIVQGDAAIGTAMVFCVQ